MSIQILAPHVAEKIAAGEVVERPSSVVKEFVENALDAKATSIAITLEDGGKKLIEVLDNGVGMNSADMELSIQRHATSKISEFNDLESLHSFGFRGEALPSVAAVSDLSIISRTQSQEDAFELSLARSPKAKPITFGHFLGEPHGSRIRAEGLFSQIPARLKFLKSNRSEITQVREWVERLSLTHPEVAFRFVHDDKTLFKLPSQNFEERIKEVLSQNEDYPVVFQELKSTGITGKLYWLQGMSIPHTKKMIQIVNGRILKDRLLQQALLNPFRQSLLPGQFPALVLHLEIDPKEIDVNIHPTKTEVRFLNSGQIFKHVQSLVEKAVYHSGAPSYVPSQSQDQPFISRTLTEPLFRSRSQHSDRPKAIQESFSLKDSFQIPSHPESNETFSSDSTDHKQPDVYKTSNRASHLFKDAVYLGTVFQTYLVFDLGKELGLIDQHAAHERIRYEALKKSILNPNSDVHRQALLLPEAIQFDEENIKIIEERLPLLEKCGFEVEVFSDQSVLFRAIPSVWNGSGLKVRLKGLVEKLINLSDFDPENSLFDEALFEKIASQACRSSIMAGDRLLREEALSLTDSLFETDHPWNCPHGRPTVVKINQSKFEEWFQRKI